MTERPMILAILYAAPIEAKDRVAVEAQSRSAHGAQDLGAPFETTLEEALAAIERQPRGYVEPDGSFSLHASPPCDDGGSGENAAVRIDGEIYDFVVPGIGSRVHHVDVRGSAVGHLWRTVFDALTRRGPEGIIVFLPSAGEALSGEAFLARLAAT